MQAGFYYTLFFLLFVPRASWATPFPPVPQKSLLFFGNFCGPPPLSAPLLYILACRFLYFLAVILNGLVIFGLVACGGDPAFVNLLACSSGFSALYLSSLSALPASKFFSYFIVLRAGNFSPASSVVRFNNLFLEQALISHL